MSIKEINSDTYKQLLDKEFAYITIFNSPEWLAIYDKNIKLYGIFDNNNGLTGSFFLYFEKKFGLTHVKLPPYTPHIGLIYENKSKNFANTLSLHKTILNEIVNFVNKLSYSVFTISLPPHLVDVQPFIWSDFKAIPNYTYRYDLIANSEEDLQARMSAERRNDIKKAIKDGIKTELCYDYNIVKQLILKTFTRKEKPLNEKLLDKILFNFANSSNSFAFVSYRENMPIATSFCIYNELSAYYLLGGYDSQNKHQGAGANAVWEAVKHSKKLQLNYFDFEGSMIKAVEKYFRGFGGNLTPYFTINKANFLLEVALKKTHRNIF